MASIVFSRGSHAFVNGFSCARQSISSMPQDADKNDRDDVIGVANEWKVVVRWDRGCESYLLCRLVRRGLRVDELQ